MLLTDELLLKFQRCRRSTFLEFYGNPQQKNKEKDFCEKLKQEKIIHTEKVLSRYNLPYQEPKKKFRGKRNIQELAQVTEDLMSQGVECIYQPVIKAEFCLDEQESVTVISSPSILIKEQNKASRWGNWSYYAVNVYLGKNHKKEYKLISALHAEILTQLQGVMPSCSEIVLRSRGKIFHTVLPVWMPRSLELVTECFSTLKAKDEPELFISRQRCGLCPWYNSCYSVAKSIQHLSLIPGITPPRYDRLKGEGIDNFSALVNTSLSTLQSIFPDNIADVIYKQTLSLKSNQAILKNDFLPAIPDRQFELYFDIETEPDRNLHYLLGVLLVDRHLQQQQYYSFLAKNSSEEATIWHNFLQFIEQYPQAPIFHYSEYEVETIKYLANRYHTPSAQLQSILERTFDLYKCVVDYYFLPLENYSLKSIANWLNFYWRNPQTGNLYQQEDKILISGDQCVFWYHQWLTTNNSRWLDYILIYNHDDCFATYELKKWLNCQHN